MAANQDKGFEWQVGIWNKMADVYQQEIDRRFAPVVDLIIHYAGLNPGHSVLDLGSGTGAVSFAASPIVADQGHVTAVDVTEGMLSIVRAGAEAKKLTNITAVEGRGESIPVGGASQNAVLASLSLMYAIDRDAAAQEIARVLRPGGRLVASVWGPPQQCDIVLFQQTAGQFAPEPPVPGVGPGALADPTPFMDQLANAGMIVNVETKITEFSFPDFESAWDSLAAVTAASLPPDVQQEAKQAVQGVMWPDPSKPRGFSNATHLIAAMKPNL